MNLIIFVLATVALFVGLISMFTPIPGVGSFLIAGGLSALICTSPKTRSFVRACRSKIKFIDKIFFWLEKTVGSKITFVGSALHKTRPGNTEASCSIQS